MHAEPNADTQRAAPPAPLIALLTFGTGGDLQPFLTLAEGLQRRGRRILLVLDNCEHALDVVAASMEDYRESYG